MPEILDDVGNCVEAVLRRVGPRVVLALPLGIGKPNPLVNEFYRRALRAPALDLTIITALSLLKPTGAPLPTFSGTMDTRPFRGTCAAW